jgi:hypothetical protein
MVSGKRRQNVPLERLSVACSIIETAGLFTRPGYPWHLYIIKLTERDCYTEHANGLSVMQDHCVSFRIKKEIISFKYNGLTCKSYGNANHIIIYCNNGHNMITVRFDRVMTIEEIAHFLESEIINAEYSHGNTAVRRIKRDISLGVGEIRREELGLGFGIIGHTKCAM